MNLPDLLADAVTEPITALYPPYMVGLGARIGIRWADWIKKRRKGRCAACRKDVPPPRWWTYPWHDLKGWFTLAFVGAGFAWFWTGGFWVIIVSEYTPVDLSGVVVTRSMSGMVGYLLSVVVCRRLKLEV